MNLPLRGNRNCGVSKLFGLQLQGISMKAALVLQLQCTSNKARKSEEDGISCLLFNYLILTFNPCVQICSDITFDVLRMIFDVNHSLFYFLFPRESGFSSSVVIQELREVMKISCFEYHFFDFPFV